MKRTGSTIRALWDHPEAARGFRTGVSLHSHTLYSEEPLSFLPRPLGWIASRGRPSGPWPGRLSGDSLDFRRMWWTPPLSPRAGWLVEKGQIENRLGLAAIVSLTDHDNIEAPLLLRVLEESRETPVSVEWTVPFRQTFFHLGVHNLPWTQARELFSAMQAYTARPAESRLGEVLWGLSADPRLLIVFNHPLWDEKGIGGRSHRRAVDELLRSYRGCIHALEWNGFRGRAENQRVAELAAAHGIPVISGGDRHGCAPNVNLNLTGAETFAEFAGQIRRERRSDVLLMPAQRESVVRRVARTLCDAIRDDPQHGMGWTRWSDRVFYRCDDGAARPLSAIWGHDRLPGTLSAAVRSLQALDRLLAHPRMRSAAGEEGL